MCGCPSCTPPIGDLALNPGMCPDWKSNWQPFGSQDCTQSTEPHQPGQHSNISVAFPPPHFILENNVCGILSVKKHKKGKWWV